MFHYMYSFAKIGENHIMQYLKATYLSISILEIWTWVISLLENFICDSHVLLNCFFLSFLWGWAGWSYVFVMRGPLSKAYKVLKRKQQYGVRTNPLQSTYHMTDDEKHLDHLLYSLDTVFLIIVMHYIKDKSKNYIFTYFFHIMKLYNHLIFF